MGSSLLASVRADVLLALSALRLVRLRVLRTASITKFGIRLMNAY